MGLITQAWKTLSMITSCVENLCILSPKDIGTCVNFHNFFLVARITSSPSERCNKQLSGSCWKVVKDNVLLNSEAF